MTASETVKALARIRWQAEAGLSGFETLTLEGALASARLSLESIIDALERLDNTDGTGISGVGRVKAPVGYEAQVVSFDAAERLQREPARLPLGLGAEDGDSLKDEPVAGQVHHHVGLQEDKPAVDGGDNVLPIFDRLADRVARDRLRRGAALSAERET